MPYMCHYILNMIVLFLMIDFIKTIDKCFAIYKILPIFVTDNQQEMYSSIYSKLRVLACMLFSPQETVTLSIVIENDTCVLLAGKCQ